MSSLFPVISMKVQYENVELDEIEIKWLRIAFHEPSEPGDWAGVFHWTQKSEIAKDFITQQKVVCD